MGAHVPKHVHVAAASAAVTLSTAALLSSYISLPPSPRLLAVQAAGRANAALALSAVAVGAATRSPRLGAAGVLCAATWIGRGSIGVRRSRRAATPNERTDLVVVSANTLWENERHDDVAASLAGCGADVIVSVESTEGQRDALTAALRRERERWVLATEIDPDRRIQPAIWVRSTMLADAWDIPLDVVRTLPVVTLDVSGRRVLVGAVHTQSPTSTNKRDLWQHHLATLATTLHGRRTPIVLAGDFNASLEHAAMRPLLATMTDAAQAAGNRWCPTWPSGRSESTSVSTPLLDLDHVLVSAGVGVVSFSTFAVPGADHLAVRAELSLTAADASG